MQTSQVHSLKADNVSARKTWEDRLRLEFKTRHGNVDHTVEVEVTPQQLKDLLRQGRNTLIDAKIVRGKKRYS